MLRVVLNAWVTKTTAAANRRIWETEFCRQRLQRPLRRALLSADPCLRHGDERSRRGHLTSRQNAVGRRGARPSAPARAPHPLALAFDPHSVPGRWPLRPARGDDLVRGQRRRLRVRPARHEAALEKGRRDGRHRSQRARFGRQRATGPAPGTRSGAPSPASRPRGSGSTSASSSPISTTAFFARVALRNSLLRARAGGKSHQGAQGSACLRSYVLPLGAGQPGPPRSAHRRLLVEAQRMTRERKPK
jgi:hypothetical protein